MRDRMKTASAAQPDDVSTTALGDWFATPLMWRPQAVLLVNTRTMLPVLTPLAPAAKLLDRVPSAIAEVLAAHGVSDEFIAAELDAMADVRLTKTNSRQILGVMNELIFHAEHRFVTADANLLALSIELADVMLGPLDYSTPAARLASVVRGESSPAENKGTQRGQHVVSLADKRAEKAAASVRQFKVTLNGSKPPIWRRVVVAGGQPLGHLHEVIQAAFGWYGYHLHEFEIGKKRYSIPHEDDFEPVADTRTINIDEALGSNTRLRYVYDFGDYWVHDIVVESGPEEPVTLPSCVGGKRACPPEDCGGMWGYGELLAILADPSHPEHRERSEWLPGPFDPEAFDPGDFEENLRLQRLGVFDPFD